MCCSYLAEIADSAVLWLLGLLVRSRRPTTETPHDFYAKIEEIRIASAYGVVAIFDSLPEVQVQYHERITFRLLTGGPAKDVRVVNRRLCFQSIRYYYGFHLT